MFVNEKYIQGDQNVQVPAHLNFGKFIVNGLRQWNDGIALENTESGETMIYRDLVQYVVNLATGLTKLGVRSGDVVAVGTEKRITQVPTMIGVIACGAIFTPHDYICGHAELRHKMNITQPKYFITSQKFWNKYKDVLEEFNCIKTVISFDNVKDTIPIQSLIKEHHDINTFEPPEVKGQTDLAIILYSSGTTAMPKGVTLTHLNCILNSLPHDFKDESLKTAYIFGAWYHNYDIFTTFKFLMNGRKLAYLTEVTYEGILKCLEENEINIAFLVPKIIYELSKLDKKCNLPSLKIMYSRSSPLHAKTMESLKERFPTTEILQGYGMTEAGEPCSENWATLGPRIGSVGKVSPGTTIKVVDVKTREILGPNQQGEICLKGPVLMKGYIGIDLAMDLDDEGFFKTGDIGYYDEDKYFYVIDRLKEFVLVKGWKVSPLELETILNLHPGVRESCVVGKRLFEFDELPTAFVVKQPNYDVTEEELVQYVNNEVAPPYKNITGGVQFVSELPRNPRGKLLRRVLREQLNKTS